MPGFSKGNKEEAINETGETPHGRDVSQFLERRGTDLQVLGIDTATPVASVALVDGGIAIGEQRSSDAIQGTTLATPFRANHAEVLFPLIQRLLQGADLSWEGISAIAVSIGPGSFTGLRIGLSAAKGLAYGWDIPVVGVSTLLAMACRVGKGRDGWICPVLDARKGEVYTSLFRRERGLVTRSMKDMVATAEGAFREIASITQDDSCMFIGVGNPPYADAIEAIFGNRAQVGMDLSYPSTAFGVGYVGEGRVRRGDLGRAEVLVPQYLRASEARSGQKSPETARENGNKPYASIDKDESLG